MSASKKARSTLGKLTEERQLEIAEHTRAHTLAETVEWLRADGLRVGQTALSEWFASWRLEQTFQRAASSANQFKHWLAQSFPDLSEAEMDRRAGLQFQFEAMKTGDPETYLAFATARHRAQMDQANLKLKEQQVSLDARRVALLEAKAAQADQARTVVESKASPEEKQLKLRQIFGMT
jgi:hypothetical protein